MRLAALFLLLAVPAWGAERSPCPRREFLQLHDMRRNPAGYQIDHREPLWRGGPDEVANLWFLDMEAHLAKTRSEAKERAQFRRQPTILMMSTKWSSPSPSTCANSQPDPFRSSMPCFSPALDQR